MHLTVIIPTYNGFQTLRELFAVLRFQTLQPDELLVIDSSSDDGTVDLCREHGADVLVIPKEEFDHGGSRSMIAERATGDILVFFTQDILPATRDALEKLVAPILDDPDIGVTYGRQMPGWDATFAAAHLRRFNYPEESQIRGYDDRHTMGITTMFTSNSFAAYRKSALEGVDYFKNGLIFGEDTCTVGRLLQAGFMVGYVSDAKVYHSHNYDLIEEFRRSFDIGVLHRTEQELFADFGIAEDRGVEYVLSAIRELWGERKYSLLVDFILRAGMKLVGYKVGKIYKKIPLGLAGRLSMHRSWWEKYRS